MTIVLTHPDSDNFHLFEQVPAQIYPAAELPLKISESIDTQYCIACFVLMNGAIPQGRAMVYRNPEIKHQGLDTLLVGHYECVKDALASTSLLEYLIAFATGLKAAWLIGPMNGSTWNNYRFCTGQPSARFFQEPQHPGYYPEQWISSGFSILAGYYSGITDQLQINLEHVNKRQEEFAQQQLTIRSIDLQHYEEELEQIYPFLLEAFASNFLYSGIAKKDFMEKYLPLKKYLNPDFVLIAEDKTKNIVGLYLCIDDFYDQDKQTLIIKTVARRQGPEFQGLGQVMSKMIYATAMRKGYTKIIHAFMLKDGTSVKSSRQFSGVPFKHYHLYGLRLSS